MDHFMILLSPIWSLKTHGNYIEKRNQHIIQNVSFCVPRKKASHTILNMRESKGAFTPASFSLVELHLSSFSLLVRFVWAGENAAITLGWAPKADQTSVPRPWRGGLGTLLNEPWSGSFMVRAQYDLKQTQLQKELCIFGLNQLP